MRLLQDHFGGHCGRPSECRALAIAAALLGLLVAAPVAQAQEPIQTFFVPVPAVETQIWAEALQPVVDNDVVRSVISITGTSAGTVIYYDHWEEGFEFDVTSPAQASTLIWGDFNPANGDVSLFCASCAGDTVGAGDIIILENDVDVTGGVRDPAVILFDGADKIQATQLLAVTRASWSFVKGETNRSDGLPGRSNISPSSLGPSWTSTSAAMTLTASSENSGPPGSARLR